MWWPRRPHVLLGTKHAVDLAVNKAGKMPALDDLYKEVNNLDAAEDGELITIQAIIEHYADNGFARTNTKQVRRLREDLWEFKGKAADFGLRIIFYFEKDRRVILLTAFRKNEAKTPDSEINRALRVMKEFKERESKTKAPMTTATTKKNRKNRRKGGRR